MNSTIAAVLLIIVPLVAGKCPDYWTGVGTSCYKVSFGTKSWFGARQVNNSCYHVRMMDYTMCKLTSCFMIIVLQYCKQEGGDLIEIRDNATQVKTRIKLAIKSCLSNICPQAMLPSLVNTASRYWIGLADFDVEGTFVWQNSKEEADYVNWAQGHPINLGTRDCVVLVRYS